MPITRTAMRVPSGDAIEQVLAAGDGALRVEVENESPAAFVVAFVVTGARSIELEKATVVVDDQPVLRTARPPGRWAIAPDGELTEVVVRGDARQGAFPGVRARRRRTAAAFLHPLAHRARLAAVLGGSEPVGSPDAEAVARGWHAQLRRGMRVDLPEARLNEHIDGARAQLVLAAGMASDPDTMAALEDWGLDDEARLAWHRLRLRDRRRARNRSVRVDAWPEPPERGGDARFLLAVRDVLGRESDDAVEIVRVLPDEWRGRPVEVHDLPVKEGTVSYAVRWHGSRPALLWDAPPGMHLRCPGLDPAWSTTERTGEELLARPETSGGALYPSGNSAPRP